MPLKIMLLLVLLSTCTALLKKKLNVYDTKIFILFFFWFVTYVYLEIVLKLKKPFFSMKIRLFRLKLACFEREKKF